MDFFTPENLALGLAWYAVFVFSTTLHEAAHAWSAWKMGDSTAYLGGQVSLNPLPHIEREPIGMVLVPLLSLIATNRVIGWASAPFNPHWAERHPHRAAWMALAGPAANLLIVLIAGLLIRLGFAAGWLEVPAEIELVSELVVGRDDGLPTAVAKLLSITFYLNLLLFVFNLLPLPPLDGSSALGLILSPSLHRRYQDFMRQPGFAMIGLIIAITVFPKFFLPVFVFAVALLYLGA